MESSEIATALETTTTGQRSRYIPTADSTNVPLRERFEAHADALPCASAATGRIAEAYGSGTPVGVSARNTGVAPITAAKLLHRCDEASVILPTPEARHTVRNWIDGRISRADALAPTDAEPSKSVLAVHVETHDPIDPLVKVVEGVLADRINVAIAKRDSLAEAMSSVTDMQL